MVFDFKLPKRPMKWFAPGDVNKKPTWVSVPLGITLEDACAVMEEDPKDWELAKGSYLIGFTEYRRKEDD